MTTPAQEFLRQAAEKSADAGLRAKLRKNIASYDATVQRGLERYVDWEAARRKNQQIKWEAVNHLDRYLLEFEAKVKARGGHVVWAETAQDAREYILNLAAARGVKRVVKSKSMATEEIHLNAALEAAGIEAVETDLGEFIVQLRGEPPYHIVTPAMHLTRGDVAQLFRERLGPTDTDDPPQLVAMARRALREKFFSAEMAISGANFLVADCGMIAITTNEGNARLCVSLPKIHVAVAGIEKVVPRLEDLATLWPSLATAGTGQGITVYNTLIGGPRLPQETDGPEEFHVVLLDNGRTDLLADAEQREVLHCIRCGACLNACPVYRTVGGHAYGTTYQGPIGSVLTPHLRGPQWSHLSYASSLCGACTSVCPVRIDLHHHLLHNRRNAVADKGGLERMAFRIWSWAMRSPARYRLSAWLLRRAMRVVRGLGLGGSIFDPTRAWSRNRAPLEFPRKSFREMWRAHGGR